MTEWDILLVIVAGGIVGIIGIIAYKLDRFDW